MDGKYYYDASYKAPTHIWGIENQTFGILVLCFICAIFFSAVIWACWGDQIIEWWRDRLGRKKVKSFVVKVKGTALTKQKFQYITDDVNRLLAGERLLGASDLRGKKELKTRNIIGITNVPGDDCRYFIIWYKEGI